LKPKHDAIEQQTEPAVEAAQQAHDAMLHNANGIATAAAAIFLSSKQKQG
jgi:hypothetical protein